MASTQAVERLDEGREQDLGCRDAPHHSAMPTGAACCCCSRSTYETSRWRRDLTGSDANSSVFVSSPNVSAGSQGRTSSRRCRWRPIVRSRPVSAADLVFGVVAHHRWVALPRRSTTRRSAAPPRRREDHSSSSGTSSYSWSGYSRIARRQ